MFSRISWWLWLVSVLERTRFLKVMPLRPTVVTNSKIYLYRTLVKKKDQGIIPSLYGSPVSQTGFSGYNISPHCKDNEIYSFQNLLSKIMRIKSVESLKDTFSPEHQNAPSGARGPHFHPPEHQKPTYRARETLFNPASTLKTFFVLARK